MRDVELIEYGADGHAVDRIVDADPHRTILVVADHRDDRMIETRIADAGQGEQQLAGEPGRRLFHRPIMDCRARTVQRLCGHIDEPRGLLCNANAPLLDSRRRTPNVSPAQDPPQRKDASMTITTGDSLPDTKLVKVTEGGPEQVSAADYFKGRKVALFSVPGAFTPTCSAKHLPGFVEKAAELKAKGIDEIVCTAVNDAFVMGAWAKNAGATDSVTMLADGNGDFAEAVGLTMDGKAFGMGKRGQRFSMVVNDGVVEQLNVEAPGEFKVSSADHMLEQL